MRLSWVLAAGTLIHAICGSASGQTTIYVDQDATGPIHDGSSWCSAFLTLRVPLYVAVPGTTIRVAEGTYTPDPTGLDDPREATFQLLNGVILEGGYAGCGAEWPDDRDTIVNETVLSGDLNGDDASDLIRSDLTSSDLATASAAGRISQEMINSRL